MKRNGSQLAKEQIKVQKTMSSTLLTTPVKSKSDKKDYRLIRLENGLRALLIHHEWEESPDEVRENQKVSESESDDDEEEEEDEEQDRQKLAAVSLNIGAGSFNDPPDIQGLFHYIEHMIFMGSEKYPKENELDQFLSKQGGSSNAHTECEYTQFYFDVVEESLAGAVDRFASLFVSPLMLRDSMSREIEAVESEFQNSINDDDNRIVQIFASKANGVVSTFTWGNSRTLRDEVNADKLYCAAHEMRKKFYVANNMWLSIESAESLDNLQRLVEEKFSGVASGDLPVRKENTADYFKEEFFDKVFYVKPKGDKCKLYVTFVMPSMEKHYKAKPHDYLSYVIQHEGVGSLNSYLKKNLLALRVDAGADDQTYEANSLYTLFGIEILLTEKGYEKMDQVLEALFSTLAMLKATPIEQHEKCFNELKQLHDTSFDYREEKTPSENTELLAVGMKYYEPRDIITGPDIYQNFDGEMILKLIEILNGEKLNLTILTDKLEKYSCTEKWFGTEYEEVEFPEHIKALWRDRQLKPESFFIPPPNEFICTNFDIVFNNAHHDHESTALPRRILAENCGIEAWYKLDKKFLLPHGFISCYLVSPLAYKSPRNIVLTSLYSMTVKHYLTERLYPALCAGLGYTVSAAERGLLIKLSGYSEKIPLVLELIAKELRNIATQIEPAVFETYREQCKRNGYNNLINSTFFNRDCRLSIVEEQHHFSFQQYSEADSVTFDELVTFAKAFPDDLHVKLLVLGNFRESEAIEITRRLEENLKFTRVDEKLARARKIPVTPQNVLYVKSPLPNDKNSTITNYYQIGASTVRLQCLIEFVEKLMEEPLFDILRTKEQLGYAVSCSHRANNGTLGFTLTLQIQEEKHTTVAVDERIEKFLHDDFKKILAHKLDDEEFEVVKSSLIKLKKMEEVEMETEHNRLWSEIASSEYLFTRFDLEAEMIARLKKREVQEFYENVLLKASKLSIHVMGTKKGEIDEDTGEPILRILGKQTERDDAVNVIADLIEFRNQLELLEAHPTVVDL